MNRIGAFLFLALLFAAPAAEAQSSRPAESPFARNKPEFMKDLIGLLPRNGQTERAQRLLANLVQK